MTENNPIQLLLAEDDKDDCLLFRDAVEELQLQVELSIVNDGEQLMSHLTPHTLPFALFLDLNMPRKNGYECLLEIKSHSGLSQLPVVIFSTSYDDEKAGELYAHGAHYYICKPPDFEELKEVIHRTLHLLKRSTSQPPLQSFFINKLKTVL